MMEKEIIEVLISRYLQKDLDPKEIEFLESWRKSSEQNRADFDRIRRVLEEQDVHFPEQSVQKARERIKTIMISRLIARRTKSRQLAGIFSILLVLTSSVAVYFAYQTPQNAFVDNNNFFSVKTGKGECSECVLPDSTHLWLNSNSEISYRLKDDGKVRCVDLKGEAFFDVAKIKKVPFEVTNGNIRVKVFGTRFNFKTADQTIQVTLEEGSLGIYTKEEKEIARLIPGVQALVDQSGSLRSLEKVDTKATAEWTTGTFEFKDVSLEVIAGYLSDFYGVTINYKNESLKKERFRCVINKKRSILQTLELLKQTSGLDYSISGSEIIFK